MISMYDKLSIIKMIIEDGLSLREVSRITKRDRKIVTKYYKEYLKLNEQGYIITNEDMQTNINGVYAAGDVRQKKYRQITTAVADGTIALLNAEKYILKK